MDINTIKNHLAVSSEALKETGWTQKNSYLLKNDRYENLGPRAEIKVEFSKLVSYQVHEATRVELQASVKVVSKVCTPEQLTETVNEIRDYLTELHIFDSVSVSSQSEALAQLSSLSYPAPKKGPCAPQGPVLVSR